MSKRPTSRVVLFALELASAGAALLLMGGTAMADTTTNVRLADGQVTTSGSAVVETSSTQTASNVQSEVVTDTSATGTAQTDTAQAETPTPITAEDSTAISAGAVDTQLLATSSADPVQSAAIAVPLTQTILTQEATQAAAVAATAVHTGTRSSLVHYATIFSQSGAAELLPSIPASAPAPANTPVKSTGLLKQLTDNLSTMIVPGLIRLDQTLPAYLPVAVSVIVFTLLLTDLIILSLGSTQRRLRYIHAARSELPNLSFAPPHLLGYVPALGHVT